jgi:hypothetical protein
VREIPGLDRLPLVLLDTRPTAAQKAEAERAGATAYFPKPLDWLQAGGRIMDLLEHLSRRRFSRYSARLAVRARSEGDTRETTETVARGGFSLQSRRDLEAGSVERLSLALPRPLPPIEVDGLVVASHALPGCAAINAGIQILRFQGDGESRWIRVIEELARRSRRLGQPSDA